MNTPLFTLDQINVHRGSRIILSNISLSIQQGEIVTVIGPNGAGKTTLLKVILGLTDITSGQIWRDHDWRVGYMPQLTRMNTLLPISVDRFLKGYMPSDIAPQMLFDVAQKTGVHGLLSSSLHKLSGGEVQRVMLARALLAQPNILIMDEPTQGLDIAGQRAFYSLIQSIVKETDCAAILVSHDLHTVMAASHRVVCLNGHICCMGTPKSVQSSDAFAQLFGPSQSETLALYAHDPEHDHTHGHHHTHSSSHPMQS